MIGLGRQLLNANGIGRTTLLRALLAKRYGQKSAVFVASAQQLATTDGRLATNFVARVLQAKTAISALLAPGSNTPLSATGDTRAEKVPRVLYSQ